MSDLEQYRSAEALETFLGDPSDPSMPISFAGAVAGDERDAFPQAGYTALEQWGMAQHYVPEANGGQFRSLEELLALWRAMARRDLTATVAHVKTFLGAVPVWVAGSPEQQARLAAIIRQGGQVALAYHEKAHGSDMAAGEMTATPCEGSYTLHGEKWLVNNATRSAAVTTFAQTNPRGGPRGFSLFLVEKAALAEGSFTHLPVIKTQGIRGADFSGIRFDGCQIPSEALLGREGQGTEQSLRSFQLTRTVLPGLSLGAADTALRVTLDFTQSRRLYGDTVFALPQPRATLVNAFLDLLICDCVAISNARAAQAAPDRLRQWSAIAKYVVPTTLEQTVRDLGVVLGARHYLREGHWWGVFGKILRDIDIVSVFHAGTFLNLITVQLQYLADGRAAPRPEDETRARLAAMFALRQPLPPLDMSRLELVDRGRDDVLVGLELALAELRGPMPGVAEGVQADILALAERVSGAVGQQAALLARIKQRRGVEFSRSPELFELARRHCALHAAAACVQMWLRNREYLGAFFGQGEWLALCLARLLGSIHAGRPALSPVYTERVAAELARLAAENRLFSIVPLQLAGSGAPQERAAAELELAAV